MQKKDGSYYPRGPAVSAGGAPNKIYYPVAQGAFYCNKKYGKAQWENKAESASVPMAKGV